MYPSRRSLLLFAATLLAAGTVPAAGPEPEGAAVEAAVPAVVVEEAAGTAWSVTALWDSKYMFQGRDVLAGDGGLASIDASAVWSNCTAGIWAAQADSNEYAEVDLYAQYARDVGPVNASFTWSRFEYTDSGDSDNELALGVSSDIGDALSVGLEYAWSTELEGGFAELTVSSEFAVDDEKITLSPYLMQAFDFGYATPGHDGPNHLQAGIDGSYALGEHYSLVLSLAHAFAQEDVERSGQDDESWVSVGLSASY